MNNDNSPEIELLDGPPPPGYVPEPPKDVVFPLEFYGVPPRWLSDIQRAECASCFASFGFFVRRHHCRACGDIFCDLCTQNKVTFPSEYGYTQPERICEGCRPLLLQDKGGRKKSQTAVKTPRKEDNGRGCLAMSKAAEQEEVYHVM